MTPDRNAWSTPDWLFLTWHEAKKFTVDACALPWNAKLPRYWTPEQDGLKQSWAGHRVWCNPPYGKGLIEPWVTKALAGEAELVVLLLPCRTEMPWFQKLRKLELNRYGVAVRRVELHFLAHRVKFVPPPGVIASSPNERSFIAVVTRV